MSSLEHRDVYGRRNGQVTISRWSAYSFPAALTDNQRMDPAARRSLIMLAVIIGAMAIFAVIYLVSGGATPDPSPMP